MRRWAWIVVAAASTAASGQALPEHVVRPGESLASIARQRLGDVGAWRKIARLNNLSHPHTIRPGQILKLPAVTAPPPVEPDGEADRSLASAPVVSPTPLPSKVQRPRKQTATREPRTRPDWPRAQQPRAEPTPTPTSQPAEGRSSDRQQPETRTDQPASGAAARKMADWETRSQRQLESWTDRYRQWAKQAQQIDPSVSFLEEQLRYGSTWKFLGLMLVALLVWWFFFGACL
ncbi:MAG: LysM peptidoglycan-binding domain-containing protein, partial [Phycisphaeraceae bacterium]|nr:LysM peptidoglycan-binding domain-containing protein [Phycisphaeraceae bacterium]